MKLWMKIVLTSVFLLMSYVVNAAGFDHSTWNGLLQKHVILIKDGQASQVDYQGMLNDRAKLS